MERTIKPISQILIYNVKKYSRDEMQKDLVASFSDVRGALNEEINNLFVYSKDNNYIGVIDLKCSNTIVNVIWSNEED